MAGTVPRRATTLLHQLQAAAVGQADVADDQVEVAPSLLLQGLGDGAGRRGLRGRAPGAAWPSSGWWPARPRPGGSSRGRVGAGARRRSRWKSTWPGSSHFGSGRAWSSRRKVVPSVLPRALGHQDPAVALDDPLADRQAEAEAAEPRVIEVSPCWNGSKIRSTTSGSMPIPVSATSMISRSSGPPSASRCGSGSRSSRRSG